MFKKGDYVVGNKNAVYGVTTAGTSWFVLKDQQGSQIEIERDMTIEYGFDVWAADFDLVRAATDMPVEAKNLPILTY